MSVCLTLNKKGKVASNLEYIFVTHTNNKGYNSIYEEGLIINR